MVVKERKIMTVTVNTTKASLSIREPLVTSRFSQMMSVGSDALLTSGLSPSRMTLDPFFLRERHL